MGVVGAASLPASAQSALGITLGAPIPEGLPAPLGTRVQAPYAQTAWADIDGVMVSVIADVETGSVVFVELRPSPSGVPPIAAQIDGFFFGQTTRADLHARFGSEGLVFENVGRAGSFGEIAAYFTTYELASDADVVVAFTTIEPLATATEDSAGLSTLDSVVLAQGAYLTEIWGLNRGRLPGYTPIDNPF